MSYGVRFVDWLRSLTAKTTTIDGTEQVHIESSGLSLKATLANVIRYGGGSPRNATAGNATVTQTTGGAMYLEVSGQTAGNARGTGVFDWQATRTNAAAVASGMNAVAIGADCVASGPYSVAIGRALTASGSGSNTAFGFSNTVSSIYGLVFGRANMVSGNYAAGWGYGSVAANAHQVAWGCPNVAGNQGNLQTFYIATTDAISTPLNITGTATDRMVIPATRAVAFIGIVQAMCNVSSSSNFIKAWRIEGVITRDGNNTTRLVGTPTITELAKDADGTPTPSTWAVTSITADDTNEALAINVTGQAATTIRWQATLLYSQVGF